MKKLLLGLMMLGALAAYGQTAGQTTDVMGAHNLSAGNSPVSGANSNACLYCHAPHSGSGKGPLWGQSFSSQTYTLYTSDTAQNVAIQPEIGKHSSLCLSCHDGTVAPGQTLPSGQIPVSGTMKSVLGTQLESSHPFSLQLPLKNSPSLVTSLTQNKTTADATGAVKLINGNVECTSCHNPHVQNTDISSPNFLVKDNRSGGLCLSCHEIKPQTVNGRDNPLANWNLSVHGRSAAQVAPAAGLGGYTTVAEFACLSCHAPHNAGGAAGLLRNPSPPLTDVDTTSQSCTKCHDGSKSLVQPIANVLGELRKSGGGHPFAATGNTHTATEAVVLQQNRHATCADCHNAHTSNEVALFTGAPDIRPSQSGVMGVAVEGTVGPAPATKQYENCLRCHGTSAGKQSLPIYGYLPNRGAFGGDPLNLIPQFDSTALSSHPVMRNATGRAQASLLSSMWDLTGKVQMRAMGTRIFCTDCHNSDDNREFGGAGPNGPHGSANAHILERPYVSSQVSPGIWPSGGPGTSVTNLSPMSAPYPQLDPGSGGPYSLCAKCHNLQNLMTNATFATHSNHTATGVSCSTCHTAHGVPVGATSGTGARLINFDTNVVAPYKGALTYTGTGCNLVCHMKIHTSDGTVTDANPSGPAPF